MPILHLTRRALLGATALAAPVVARHACAEAEWPHREPVKVIVSYPAGGPSDTQLRLAFAQVEKLTGGRFILEYKSGAGGTVGAEAIARSKPDGYTVGLMNVSTHVIAPILTPNIQYNVEKDVTPVATLFEMPNILITNKDFPVKTVPELIAQLKEAPGKYTIAHPGVGTTVYLSAEFLKTLGRVDVVTVSYRGNAPAIQDVLAGNVDMIFANMSDALPWMRAGKMKAFGVTSKERSPSAPDVPAMAETLPGFDMVTWGGVCGPAKMPEAIVQKLSLLLKQALESEKVKSYFESDGVTNIWKNPEKTREFLRTERERLIPIIKASGAKLE